MVARCWSRCTGASPIEMACALKRTGSVPAPTHKPDCAAQGKFVRPRAHAHLEGDEEGGAGVELHGPNVRGESQEALGRGVGHGTDVVIPRDVHALGVAGARGLALRLGGHAGLLGQVLALHALAWDNVPGQVAGQVAVGGELGHAVLRRGDALHGFGTDV